MESNQTSEYQRRYRIFFSYATADRDKAQEILDVLRHKEIDARLDAYELEAGDSIFSTIESAVSASDFLVVLLSNNSVKSDWIENELGATLASDLTTRDITVLPVLIEDCEIPPSLASYQLFDLRTNFDRGIVRLAEQIGSAKEIDFSKLDWRTFENLVADLLEAVGFVNIEQELAIDNRQVDMKANYLYHDPFGAEVRDTWIVEIKFYQQSRADLKSIHQLAGYLSNLSIRSKGLLITNSQLTSAAKAWLESAESRSRVEIRVIDGTELKRLLLQHKGLVDKYFRQDKGH